MNIIFAGTPEFSLASLQTLLDSQHTVIAVYTQPDRPAGRGRKLTASPVKSLAQEHNIPVLQPVSLRDEDAQKELKALNADVMIVVAYGLILPQAVLDMPKNGCLNIHASILPRWRGAAPIQRAIESGDPETGVTIMQMDKGLDTGDMLCVLATEIEAEDTAQTLHERLQTLGCTALTKTLEEMDAGILAPIKQDNEHATYAQKMSKAEAEIDWSQPAHQIARKVQAFNPWPVCFTNFQEKPLRIWTAFSLKETQESAAGTIVSVSKDGIDVACGEGTLRITQCQPSGKKAMDAYAFGQSRSLVNQHLS